MAEEKHVSKVFEVIPTPGPPQKSSGLQPTVPIDQMTRDYPDEPAEESDGVGQSPSGKTVARINQPFIYNPDDVQEEASRDINQALVLDIDAKLVTSTQAEMKRGIFRESHFSSIDSYVKSDFFKQYRVGQLKAKATYAAIRRLQESETQTRTSLGSKSNGKGLKIAEGLYLAPSSLRKFSAQEKVLRESATKDLQPLARILKEAGFEDSFDFGGELLGTEGGLSSIDSGPGRVQEFTPIISGPWSKQLYYFDYLVMHARAFEAWCLTGDTEIALLDGRNIPILQLKEEFKSKEFIWGYKFNVAKQKVEPVKMVHVYEMGKKDCVTIILDSGQSFTASLDHPILMRNGTYKKSGELVVGDSLMPLYRRRHRARFDKEGGYERFLDPIKNVWRLTHVMVKESIEEKTTYDLYKEMGQEHAIHHKGSQFDNTPEHLEFMTHRSHLIEHMPAAIEGTRRIHRENPEWSSEKARKMQAGHTFLSFYKQGSGWRGRKQPPEVVRARMAGRKNWKGHTEEAKRKIAERTKEEMDRPENRVRFLEGIRRRDEGKRANHKVVAVYPVGMRSVFHIETDESDYRNQNFALAVGVFSHNTHNPIAKRICRLIPQFVLGGGVAATVTSAYHEDRRQTEVVIDASGKPVMDRSGHPKQQYKRIDEADRAQYYLDLHWKKNKMVSRIRNILRELLIFGEQMIRYYPTDWGYKIRQMDPSTVWEIVTNPDDIEEVFYYHQQYPTTYQWYVSIPVPTIKYIIRQVPAKYVIHFKINSVSNEKRGRSELFCILGWLKRYKDFMTDRVVLNKIRSMFGIDVSVKGGPQDVNYVNQQFNAPLAPGSFFVHSDTVVVEGISANINATDSKADSEMLLTIIALGAGVSEQYLGLAPSTTRASALVGTEPDTKNFEDYQNILKEFLQADAQKVFDRLRDRNLIKATEIKLDFTFPEIATQDRSTKLKDIAFAESMSYVSHRRASTMSAKELKIGDFDYDQEMMDLDQESEHEVDINKLYQQVQKGAADMGAAGASSNAYDSKVAGGIKSDMGPPNPTSDNGSGEPSSEGRITRRWQYTESSALREAQELRRRQLKRTSRAIYGKDKSEHDQK